MTKLTIMWVSKGGSISTEVDNLDELDWIVNEMEKRGFDIVGATNNEVGGAVRVSQRYNAQSSLDLENSVTFCPLHGDKKKWADTKDGGHYCGEKVNGTWCGYKENEQGQMVKPPKSKPDYIKF